MFDFDSKLNDDFDSKLNELRLISNMKFEYHNITFYLFINLIEFYYFINQIKLKLVLN